MDTTLSTPAAAVTCTPTKLLPVFTSLGANFNARSASPNAIEVTVTDDCGPPFRTGSVVTTFSNGDLPLTLASQYDGHWSATWVPHNGRSTDMVVTVTAQQLPTNLQGTVQISGNADGFAGALRLSVMV